MIHKAKCADKFTIIPNSLAANAELSFAARGLLLYLLSKPVEWDVTMADMRREGGCGREKIWSLLRELEAAGYLGRVQAKKKGKFQQSQYEVYSEPRTEKPCTEKPCTENATQLKKDSNKEKKEEKEKSSDTDVSGCAVNDEVQESIQPPDQLPTALTKTQLFWRHCSNALIEMGLQNKQARHMVGYWNKEYGPERTQSAIRAASKQKPADPIPYITRILNPQALAN